LKATIIESIWPVWVGSVSAFLGGNPNDSQKVTWVRYEQHAELVAWWNALYESVKGQANV
jgi:hypothetical protein